MVEGLRLVWLTVLRFGVNLPEVAFGLGELGEQLHLVRRHLLVNFELSTLAFGT